MKDGSLLDKLLSWADLGTQVPNVHVSNHPPPTILMYVLLMNLNTLKCSVGFICNPMHPVIN